MSRSRRLLGPLVVALLSLPAAAVEDLPGAPAFPPELRQRLVAALAARGAEDRPRTRHLREDGLPRYTNRLIAEASPYLLQHAHNPVNWYPWGEEAFADAKRLRRPILLSIGYSTCHWCHVMEEESFEDLEIAEVLNARYIAIKVDREERPDLDSIYMSAVSVMVGQGGWPMTSWLTSDGRPYYGGTYFPPRDGDRGVPTGFLTLLLKMSEDYERYPRQIGERAAEIAQHVERSLRLEPPPGQETPLEASFKKAMDFYREGFDRTHGGRGGAPKFPSSLPNRLLLRQSRRTNRTDLLDMATLTLTRMAEGGMYDQVGGGFHRYSTDARWQVPHFEKMLYDNALAALAYLEGFQVTGQESFARITREILQYVSREMTAPGGGFYSATDADSQAPDGEMEEGRFFTWTPVELSAVLGGELARPVAAHYGVTPAGQLEGRSVLHVARQVAELARELDLAPQALRAQLDAARTKLYAARLRRPPPLRDDKILTSWNGLMISAMARGGFVLDQPEFVARAVGAAEFVLQQMRREDRLLRSFNAGQARHNAYLDDYAFLIAGLLDLYEATFDARWIGAALDLQAILDRHHADPRQGGYFMTSDDHESLIAREKPVQDGAEPSGNSVALMNLLRLHELTGDDRYRATADRLIGSVGSLLRQRPQGLAEMLLALDFKLGKPKQLVLVTPGPDRSAAEPFLSVLRSTFLPDKVVVVVAQGTEADALSKVVPLVGGKVARSGATTAYVCEQGTCRMPTTSVEEFRRLIHTAPRAPGAAAE